MDLDNFKNTWDEMSSQVKVNQNIDLKIFDKMTRNKFHSSLKKIVLPELIGSITCIGFAIYTGINFAKLDTIAYQVVGLMTILLLVILPLISLISIQALYKSADNSKSVADTLKQFTFQKIRFCKMQKLNFTLCYLLAVTVILLSTRLFGRNSITDSKYFFIFSYGASYIILQFLSKWVFKGYNRTIQKTENLLHELSI
ncbi:MAG TPA: hypothetical protein VGG71_00835 [Chitinophagaceae bacterium]|jgi:hypothetical protein